MDIIKLLITVLIIFAMVFAIRKGFQPAMSLILLGLVANFAACFISRYSPVAKSSGSVFIDVFNYFNDTGIFTTIAKTQINIMVIAYVIFMDELKASQLFALIAAKPISKIKNKNLFPPAAYLLIILLFLVIPTGTGRIALMMGTLYPIMLACGVTKLAAASTIFISTFFGWGPANTLMVFLNTYSGHNLNIPMFFAQSEWYWDIIALVGSVLIIYFTTKYFDKKENAETEQAAYQDIEPKSLGIPMWYAIFPIAPLFLIILFSGIIKGLPIMSIAACEGMCWIIVVVILLLTAKNKKKALDDGFAMFKGMGSSLTNIISIIIGGNVFGAGILALGGINVILAPFLKQGANMNITLFLIITGLIALVGSFATITNTTMMAIFAPIYMSVLTATGSNIYSMYYILATCTVYGMAFSPATPHMALVSASTGLSIPKIIKRSAPVAIFMSLFFLIVGIIVA